MLEDFLVGGLTSAILLIGVLVAKKLNTNPKARVKSDIKGLIIATSIIVIVPIIIVILLFISM